MWKDGEFSSERIRPCRFVKIWNVCCGAIAMTANTRAMNSVGTSLWNRSDWLFTNTLDGLRQLSGWLRRSGRRLICPVQSMRPSRRSVSPANAAATLGCGLPARMVAVLIA